MTTQNTPHRESIASISQRRFKAVKSKSIYVLPNAFTGAAFFAAFYGIIQAMNGNFSNAAIAVFFSMLFDGMDGRVARLTHTQSEFGVQMDSLADAVSFGVAPALIVYEFTLVELGKLGWATAFVYALCALLRLARFNCNVGVVSKNYFQGLPSPAAAALVCGFVWLAVENRLPDWLLPYQSTIALVVTLYAGLTMVCNAPFFSGKSLAVVKSVPFWVIALCAIAFIVISSNTSLSIFILFCIYALSGFVHVFWCWWNGRPNPIAADLAQQHEEEPEEEPEETPER
ncbi:CDP-diacylglycerol--serine O-phosphatidyltransferase [Sutterella sp.]|uniref:CDP-diacylglycerol--serine O-phosphatidyltransferase n=1 Tax=Sutterella sp. TaxID=1981025 RepID=UPI0026E05686|nr:CDP-diacylglycerol--serine O-phosphatidyltransferase [Sutterella sp.]MDO5532280.1 CDP-diacylglycerol--serine O-phosphatidyltransferase [Sutterella sp.]